MRRPAIARLALGATRLALAAVVGCRGEADGGRSSAIDSGRGATAPVAAIDLRPAPAEAAPDSGADLCGSLPSPLVVSPDSIGPFPIRASHGWLRAHCPSARDSTIDGYEESADGIVLRGGPHAITATFSSARADAVADWWLIESPQVVLPDGVSAPSTWSDLRARLGPVTVANEVGLVAMPCRYPWLALRMDSRGVPPFPQGASPSLVPDSTRVEGIAILPTTISARRRRPDCG